MNGVFIWIVACGAIVGILLRPAKWPEAVWACLGAMLLVVTGLLSVARAGAAVAKGFDVYLFLTGMMLLSELAREKGVFDWLASLAVAAAKKSRARLFGLVYLVGIVVTVFLSNDATAVVLTPAVYAAVRKARAAPLPYLYICAFIANAASFVLPISNPANLVVYGKALPPLVPWFRTFLAPSVLAIAATYIALKWTQRDGLRGPSEDSADSPALSGEGRLAAWGIALTGAILIGASSRGMDLGAPTCIAAFVVAAISTRGSARSFLEIARKISWSVLPLVAGLFVLVEALSAAGALRAAGGALRWCAAFPRGSGGMIASFGTAAFSNLMNNLPSGLLAGQAARGGGVPPHIRDAVLIGVDLGPNLSVTGSLATVLWLMALRREGVSVNGWQFFKTGLIVTPPALALATIAVSILAQ